MIEQEKPPLLAKPEIPIDGKLSDRKLKELLNFPIIPDPVLDESTSSKPTFIEGFVEDVFNQFTNEFTLKDIGPPTSEISIFDAKQKKPSIRQRLRNKAREKRMSIFEKIMKPAATAMSKKLIVRLETNIGKPIKPRYAEGFNEAVLETARNPENIFVFIGNHEGLGDGAQSAIVAKQVTNLINTERTPENLFRGLMLTFSSSLKSGHQGLLWHELIREAEKKLLEYHLPLQAFTREKDKIKYDLHADNDDYNKKLKEIIKKDDKRTADGLYFYLAGNMEEGRRKKKSFPANLIPFNRHIKGIPELHCEGFHGLVRMIELRYHKKVIIVPVGSFGAFDIFDPEHHSWPTLKALNELRSNNPKSLLSVKVGLPISYDDIISKARSEAKEQKGSEEITSRDIDSELGYMLAKLLPKEAQGFYQIKP